MGFVGTVSGDTPKSGAHQQQRGSTQVKGRSRAGGQAGRPAPGTRATGGGGTASTGPVLAIPNGRSFAPGTERFSRWRTAGSRERPSIWRSGRWSDPVAEDQEQQRESRTRANAGEDCQQRAGLEQLPPAADRFPRVASNTGTRAGFRYPQRWKASTRNRAVLSLRMLFNLSGLPYFVFLFSSLVLPKASGIIRILTL